MAFFRPRCYAFAMQIMVAVLDDLAEQVQVCGLTTESHVESLIEDVPRVAPAPNPRQGAKWTRRLFPSNG